MAQICIKPEMKIPVIQRTVNYGVELLSHHKPGYLARVVRIHRPGYRKTPTVRANHEARAVIDRPLIPPGNNVHMCPPVRKPGKFSPVMDLRSAPQYGPVIRVLAVQVRRGSTVKI